MAGGGGFSMKVSKFTESQITFVLKQGEEGTPVAEVCFRQLEEENGRLKRIVADLSLDKEMLQDVIRRKL